MKLKIMIGVKYCFHIVSVLFISLASVKATSTASMQDSTRESVRVNTPPTTIAQFDSVFNGYGYPAIGKPMPSFVLKDIQDFRLKNIALEDLKGRFIVLDFWHRHCSTCIASFTKMNKLAEQFKDQIDFFLVAKGDKKEMYDFYQVLKKRYNLNIPSAIDENLVEKFVFFGYPHVILIDDQGIVRAITGSIDERQLNAFVKGEPFEFRDLSYIATRERRLNFVTGFSQHTYAIDPLKFFPKGEEENNLYGSMILKYREGLMPDKRFNTNFNNTRLPDKPLQGAAYLEHLYKAAYFGNHISPLIPYIQALKYNVRFDYTDTVHLRIWKDIIYEIKDKSIFHYDPWNHHENTRYWYTLELPEERWNREEIMKAMQEDLYRAFGYDARVEMREMPYWRLTADPGVLEKLKSTGGEMSYDDTTDASAIRFTNYPIKKMLTRLYINLFSRGYPIKDDTGFEGTIDIEIKDGLRTDFDILKRELERHGFKFILDKKPFEVLVIRDAKE